MVKSLIVSGIMFLISILLMGFCGFNTIIFISIFTIFIVIALLNLFSIYQKNNTENNMENTYFDISTKALKEKKYLKSIVYFLSYPMCVVGILLLVINMVYVWISILA